MNKLKLRTIHVALALTVFCVGNVAAAADQEGAKETNVVNINSATEVELAYLPGVGSTTASRIVAFREKRAFKTPQQLMRVKGIGRKTYRKIQKYIVVKGKTTATSKIKRSKE